VKWNDKNIILRKGANMTKKDCSTPQSNKSEDKNLYVFEHNRCQITLNFLPDSNGEAINVVRKILTETLHAAS
jgi:hypothetical protein